MFKNHFRNPQIEMKPYYQKLIVVKHVKIFTIDIRKNLFTFIWFHKNKTIFEGQN